MMMVDSLEGQLTFIIMQFSDVGIDALSLHVFLAYRVKLTFEPWTYITVNVHVLTCIVTIAVDVASGMYFQLGETMFVLSKPEAAIAHQHCRNVRSAAGGKLFLVPNFKITSHIAIIILVVVL